MRAMQIFFFILAVNAAIGMVNAVGLFNDPYMVEASGEEIRYSVSDLSDMAGAGAEPTLIDYTVMRVTWVWEAVLFIVKFIGAFVFIYPVLVEQFMIPAAVSVFLQGLIYVVYVWGWIQFRTNRSFQWMS